VADEPPVHILVIDDNPASLYGTSRILRSAGWTVSEAASGEEGLALADRGISLIILDVNLPDIGGFEVCKRLRASRSTAHIPVVHVSATFVKEIDKVHGLEAGADGYLTHPIEPPVLVATVNAFLRTRQAEQNMRLSEAKFKAVFENALNGIALIDKNLTYIEVNPSLCEMLQRSRDEIVGKPIANFMVSGQGGDVAEIVKEVEEKGSWRGQFPLTRADGETIYLEWNISRHSVPGVRLAVVSDVTERLKGEKEREALLERERAARADAERANGMKDDFLATLSHELRTPLNAIVGWSYMLRKGKPDAESLAEGLETIERNAQAQTQMISDLLDVSRITAGKIRLEVQTVDPAAMIEGALVSVMPAANAKSIRIVKVLNSNASPISGDPARLQQVVWNLVNNAVKFTPKGGRVEVKLERINSHVEISVIDNGQGIEAELLPHLFERFRQGDASTTRGNGGLGLGLAIAKQLVEMHGGTIHGQSEGENKGSIFSVRLPLSPIHPQTMTAPEAHSEETKGSAPHRPPTRLDGIRVLVVEDDADARRLINLVLSFAGAQTFVVDRVAKALEAIDSFKPNILLSDIGMPEQDGFDLIREVRGRGYTFQQLPAVVLTAFARTEDRRRALLAGFQAYASKPVDPTELTATIATLVGRTGI